MNAQEFIKQYGWGESSVIVFESIGHGANTFYDTHDELYYGQINDIRVSVAELKQFVDAWELVGGIGHSLNSVKQFCDLAGDMKYLQKRGKLILVEDIRKAIELVESVNENQD